MSSNINLQGGVPYPAMLLLGAWNASTNSPSLANGTGGAGNLYKVSVAGIVNFGAANIAFSIGDFVYYDGSVWAGIKTNTPQTSNIFNYYNFT